MNVRKLILSLLLIVVSIVGFSIGAQQKGVIILNNGDSINCWIEVYEIDIFVNSDKIEYFNKGIRSKVKSDEVAKIVFDSLIYEKFTFKRKKQVQKGPRKVWVDYDYVFFAALIKDGGKKLFKHYYFKSSTMSTGYGGYSTTSTYLTFDYYIFVEGKMRLIRVVEFKDTCLEIFSGCVKVEESLNSKNYTYKKIEDFVEFANQSCD